MRQVGRRSRWRKTAALPASFGLVFLLGVLGMACGYRPLYGARAPLGLSVVSVSRASTDAALEAEVERGARAVLARAGALRDGFPRLVVEIVESEISEAGLARHESGPVARAMRARLSGRGFIERDPSGLVEWDTGLLRTEEILAVESRALVEAWREEAALRAAARRLGEELAKRALGEPGMDG